MEYANIMVPDGPVIAIYKGWQTRYKGSIGTSKSNPYLLKDNNDSPLLDAPSYAAPIASNAPSQTQFGFVSEIPGQKRDAGVRKFIRSHVRNELVRNTRLKQKSPTATRDSSSSPRSIRFAESGSIVQSLPFMVSEDSGSRENYVDEKTDNVIIPENIGYPTALCIWEYPVDMPPGTHELLSQYLTRAFSRLYPLGSNLKTNPLKSSGWFRFAVTDPAMLHAMLYSASLYVALLEGKTESRDTVYHLGQTISIVNRRLSQSATIVEDSTIGAISCLALGEAVTGNQDLWHTHMCGLKHVIRTRRNASSIGGLLRMKLHRSDITGAIDYAATPQLDFERSECPSMWSIVPANKLASTQRDLTKLLVWCQVHPSLVDVTTCLAHFSEAIQCERGNFWIGLDPIAFAEDMYGIQYRLLNFPNSLTDASLERPSDKACRLGALLYMKAILQEFPHSSIGFSVLISQLREALWKMPLIESQRPLRIWLCLVAAGLSTDETRDWFVAHLMRHWPISSSGRDLAIVRILSMENMLRRPLEKLFRHVMSPRMAAAGDRSMV